jgi:hypothetical protein
MKEPNQHAAGKGEVALLFQLALPEHERSR